MKGDNITDKHVSRRPAGDPARERKQRIYPYTRRILQLLIANAEPIIISEIARRLNMNSESVRQALDWLHSEQLVYIAEWKRGTGPLRRAFAAGKGRDAEKLATLTNSEKMLRWRATNLGGNAQRIAKNMTLAGALL